MIDLSAAQAPPVHVRREGALGVLTLDRPKALHALTTDMCRTMTEALLAWRGDPDVAAVMIDHAGPRGFCAGGDIRALSAAHEDGGAAAREFFDVEYKLNALLFDYPKPTIAVMDGVVMGGGVGISAPCTHRMATERTVFAMPETAIGLFPDVGGGWFLPRLPGRSGLWLALTGARLKAADMLHLGLATVHVQSARLPDLKARLAADPAAAQALLAEFAADAGPPPLADYAQEIDRLFAGRGAPEILAALDADGGGWAAAQAALLRRMSPTSLCATLRELELGALAASFGEEMAREYGLACAIILRPDLREGVRALLVDRDNAPRWSPATLEEVTSDLVDALFAPPPGERWTPIAALGEPA